MLVHQLVGYDRKTERVAYERDFRPEEWRVIRSFLHPGPDDPAMVDVYPVDDPTVRDVAGIIGDKTPGDLDYFIECSERD